MRYETSLVENTAIMAGIISGVILLILIIISTILIIRYLRRHREKTKLEESKHYIGSGHLKTEPQPGSYCLWCFYFRFNICIQVNTCTYFHQSTLYGFLSVTDDVLCRWGVIRIHNTERTMNRNLRINELSRIYDDVI